MLTCTAQFLNLGGGLMINVASIVSVEATRVEDRVKMVIHYGLHGDAKAFLPIDDWDEIRLDPLMYIATHGSMTCSSRLTSIVWNGTEAGIVP